MFDLQGHRGACGLWPENTLTGFARTIELGVCALELDCGVTRDGVVVVSHDPELSPDCTRDAAGRFLEGTGPPLCTLSYQELAAYDVGRLRPGSAYAARFPQQQGLDGERIPRLTDVLTLVRTHGRGRVRACLEVKTFPEQPQLTLAPEPFVAALARAVEATGTAGLVAVIAFDWRVLACAQRLMPGVPTTALTEEQPGEDTLRLAAPRPSPWLGGLDPARFAGSLALLVQASGAGTWGPDYLDVTAERVAQMHALAIKVVPWTVNEPADMQRLLTYKVDGMVSDRPDLLRALLERQGLPLPPRPREDG